MKVIEEHSKVVAVIALLALVFAGVSLFRSDAPPKRVQEDLDLFMNGLKAQAELLGGSLEQGARVVVLDLDREFLGFNRKDYQRVLKSLEKSGVVIRQLEKLRFDEERGWDMSKSGFPYGEFLRVAEQYPDVEAVIALCGLPYFNANSPSSPAEMLPKLLAATGPLDVENTEDLFDQDWLQGGAVTRTQQLGDKVSLYYELLQKK